MKWVVFVLALLAAKPVGAATIIGNGGDVVVCSKGPQPKIQLLDFYEFRTLRQAHLDKDSNQPYFQQVERTIAKIEARFPYLAEQLDLEFAEFNVHAVFLKGVELQRVKDAYNVFLPAGCKIRQAAIQRTPVFPDDPWYYINGDLWKQMSSLDRAGLVVHELLYHLGLENNLQQSMGVRYLNGLFFSQRFLKIPDRRMVSGFLAARIRNYEVHGLYFPLFEGATGQCHILPGAVDCKVNSDIDVPNIQYGLDGALKSISYKTVAGIGYFHRGKSLKAEISEIHFLHDGTATVASFEGFAFLPMKKKGVTPWGIIKGSLSLWDGNFCGTVDSQRSCGDISKIKFASYSPFEN